LLVRKDGEKNMATADENPKFPFLTDAPTISPRTIQAWQALRANCDDQERIYDDGSVWRVVDREKAWPDTMRFSVFCGELGNLKKLGFYNSRSGKPFGEVRIA